MVKKSIILAIVLLMAGLAAVQAQETATEQTPVTALFFQYDAGQTLNITPLAYPGSFGGRLGMGFLNLFFGLGSYISGDWPRGILITILQGGGITVTVLGFWLLSEMDTVEKALFWLGPGAVITAGVILWGSGVVTGFIVPLSNPKTARIDDPRNWTVAVLPAPNGRVAGTLAFTAHF
jgi:hypothetical protein